MENCIFLAFGKILVLVGAFSNQIFLIKLWIFLAFGQILVWWLLFVIKVLINDLFNYIMVFPDSPSQTTTTTTATTTTTTITTITTTTTTTTTTTLQVAFTLGSIYINICAC